MYRITYIQGNGYHCNCCRQSWTHTEDFDTKEEVIEWLNELEACKKESLMENDYDRYVDEIREVVDEDLSYELKADPVEVQKLIEAIQGMKAKEKKEKEELAEKAKIEAEKKKLQELIEKYPEGII